jgi:hypothetical protein
MKHGTISWPDSRTMRVTNQLGPIHTDGDILTLASFLRIFFSDENFKMNSFAQFSFYTTILYLLYGNAKISNMQF